MVKASAIFGQALKYVWQTAEIDVIVVTIATARRRRHAPKPTLPPTLTQKLTPTARPKQQTITQTKVPMPKVT